jgi:hypothetical protein
MSLALVPLAPYLVSGSISLYLGYKTLKNYYNQPFEYLELEAQEIEELGSIEEQNKEKIIDYDNKKCNIIKEDDDKDNNIENDNITEEDNNVEEQKLDTKQDKMEIIDDKNELKKKIINNLSDKIVFNSLENVKNEESNFNKEVDSIENKKVEILKNKNLEKYNEKFPNKLDMGLISMDNFDGGNTLPPIGKKPTVGILPPIGETQELEYVELKPRVNPNRVKKNKKKNRKNRK